MSGPLSRMKQNCPGCPGCPVWLGDRSMGTRQPSKENGLMMCWMVPVPQKSIYIDFKSTFPIGLNQVACMVYGLQVAHPHQTETVQEVAGLEICISFAVFLESKPVLLRATLLDFQRFQEGSIFLSGKLFHYKILQTL